MISEFFPCLPQMRRDQINQMRQQGLEREVRHFHNSRHGLKKSISRDQIKSQEIIKGRAVTPLLCSLPVALSLKYVNTQFWFYIREPEEWYI